MTAPTFQIDGTDYIQHILKGGIKWSRNDIDGEDSGRTLDGIMHRNRVAIKRKLTVNMGRLTQSQIEAVTAAIEPEFINVTFVDPRLGTVAKTFYGSSVDSTNQKFQDGEVYWEGTTFSLIEK
ncbi:DUF6711 family protein [Dehalobacter restrictus]|uniref:DUF6711 family protein n=1 Tax=Dehalobacter restrictus TaxID=55583 RepID=UPI00338FD95A